MWLPSESFFIKFHIISSVATLVCAAIIIVICLIPSLLPGIYRLLADDRAAFIIPYLLFIALGEALFSIWYFMIRKRE
jgi:uncharacterized membrane protein